jgi:hypothetical protein
MEHFAASEHSEFPRKDTANVCW